MPGRLHAAQHGMLESQAQPAHAFCYLLLARADSAIEVNSHQVDEGHINR